MSNYGHADNRTPTWLYCCTNATGDLLYIGVTRRPAERLKAHKWSTPWFNDDTFFELLHEYPTGEDAYTAERATIRALRPPHNRRHNPDHTQHRSPNWHARFKVVAA